MRKILACAVASLLAACVTVQPATVTSRTNPAFAVAPPKIVVVAAPNLPLSERSAAEDAMAGALASHNVQAIRSLQLFPPDRAYSGEEVRQGLIRARAEAMLVFRGRVSERVISVAGGRFIPTETYQTEQAFGPGTLRITRMQAGTAAAPYTYDVELMHAMAPQAVWQAEAVIQGGNGASFDDLAARAARDSVGRLIADKAI